MKSMSCKDLGGPCDERFAGKDANEIINAQDAHLKAKVAAGDASHEEAAKAMKGRWKKPWSGMSWYRGVKRDFAALPDD